MNLSKFAVYSILPLSLAVLVGCDSNDSYRSDFDAPNVAEGEVRYTTIVADAPRIRFALDDNNRSWQAFATSSNIVSTYGGDLAITAEAEAADDATTAVPGTINLTVADNTRYDVLAVGSWEDGNWELVQLPAVPTGFDQAETHARVVVAHLAPDAPAVDVYVSEPEDAIGEATLVGTMSYEQNLGPVFWEEGEYRIRVTASTTTDVVFDSGTVELSAGDDIVAVAIANTDVAATTEKAPVSLLMLSDEGSAVAKSSVDPAELQLVNVVGNTAVVDTGFDLVLSADDTDTTVATDVSFNEVVDYQDLDAGDYDVTAPLTTSGSNWLDETSATLAAGETYTALLLNTVQEPEFLLVEDDPRPIFNKARLRVIHGSSVAGEVDIYVTEDDELTADDSTAAAEVAMGSATAYWNYDAGTYYVTVTPAGDKETAAIGPLEVTLSNGGVYTIVARDNETLDDVDVTLLGDF